MISNESRSIDHRPGWPYWMPFAVFMAFVFGGTNWPDYFAHAYVGRTIVVGIILFLTFKLRDRINWTHLGLGVIVGIVGTIQWIGMECLLVSITGEKGYKLFGMLQLVSDIRVSEMRDYPALFSDGAWGWIFLIARVFGPVLVVPLMEEQFWRNWVWRTVSAPNNFRLVPVGQNDPSAVWGVALMFAFVHVQFLTGVVWALLIAWLLIRTKSLGACVIAHAVTNLLLAMWILATWKFPGQWVPFDRAHWFFW